MIYDSLLSSIYGRPCIVIGWSCSDLYMVSFMIKCIFIYFPIMYVWWKGYIDQWWSNVNEVLRMTLPLYFSYSIDCWWSHVWNFIVWSSYGGGVYFIFIIYVLTMALMENWWIMSVWLWWSHNVKPHAYFPILVVI